MGKRRLKPHEKAVCVFASIAHEQAGLTASAAVAEVAHVFGVGMRTVWKWRRLCSGCSPFDYVHVLGAC
jgi:transposase-like protein